MPSRNLTLTTIGLPIRTELRLKSMLEVVKNMTVDNWSYCQDGEADLAICEPHSAMTTLAIKRAQTSGATRCALLIKDDAADASALPTLRDPIRATDFLSLLNSISALNLAAPGQPVEPEKRVDIANSADVKENSAFALAMALRTAAKVPIGRAFKLEVGGITLHVITGAKVVMQSKELDAMDIAELAELHDAVQVTEVNAAEAERLRSNSQYRSTIAAVLWRLGVLGPRDRLVSLIHPHTLLKLKRWPDFGRLEHTADHMRLAARLSRQFMGMAEMTAAINQPMEKIRPFLNACALCELLVAQAVTETVSIPAPAKKTQQAESRYKGLFQSIRSVLNFSLS